VLIQLVDRLNLDRLSGFEAAPAANDQRKLRDEADGSAARYKGGHACCELLQVALHGAPTEKGAMPAD
jgi:hypothetical protein